MRVVNVSTIKPLDVETAKKYARDVSAVVTAEEHSVCCGLGSAIAEALCETGTRIGFVGVKDRFGTSAKDYEELLKAYCLSAADVAEKVRAMLAK